MHTHSIQLKETRTSRLSRKSSHKWKWVLIPSLFLMAAYLFVAIAGGILVGDEQIGQLDALKKEESYVPLTQLPDYVPQAFVSIEDHRFNHHIGIDPISLSRSLLVDLKIQSFAQGGSTITMQLVKNQFLTQDKSLGRKAKEMLMALQIERDYTKDEILEMYLNTIYFGHGTYGLTEAAQLYFDKNLTAEDSLTLKEAAILASLPKAPEVYSPLKNPDLNRDRQAIVLEKMEEFGHITEEEHKLATGLSKME